MNFPDDEIFLIVINGTLTDKKEEKNNIWSK